MQTRFRCPTRKISDVIRALCPSPPLILFSFFYRSIASSAVPPIDLDLAQVFPFGVPTVLFEMRLLNPRIGDFAGCLKGDVVTAQCVEKFGVLSRERRYDQRMSEIAVTGKTAFQF
jgi:hypothetical protein